MPDRLLLVGFGRMNRLVAALAAEFDFEVAGTVTAGNNAGGRALEDDRWREVAVAVDFSTADAVVQNLPRLAALGRPVVVGTTGWQAAEAEMRRVVEAAGIGVVVAPNFSVGACVLEALVEQAAAYLRGYAGYGAWIHEHHHAGKRDAPSGTALALEAALRRGGAAAPVAIASTRAGFAPGVHTVGFDGPAESLTLTHAVRDRAAFARGALVAARWVLGRRGWYTMRDVLGWPPRPFS
jgi:4-hydroxy-tetrahydrodipicolinate reductase